MDDTPTVKNPLHTEATNLQRELIKRIKQQQSGGYDRPAETSMKVPNDLSQNLQPIAQHELAPGNAIERIDRSAGSTSPLGIVFATIRF